MLSYLFMKILEGRPRSYDRRMDRVSRGKVKGIKEAVAAEVPEKSHVLEIGCGTANYIRAIQANCGCECWGIDPAVQMLSAIKEESLRLHLRHGP